MSTCTTVVSHALILFWFLKVGIDMPDIQITPNYKLSVCVYV